MNKRILKEIAKLQTPEYTSQGIFYKADDTDATRGLALIVGPPDTPYAGGIFLFSVQLPPDYPFVPPRVSVLTTDGRTRFHPNLYLGGKVCLSILGTWSGPAWASTMNLGTLCVSLQSLLQANPLTCEPGYETLAPDRPEAANYNAIVKYRLCRYMIELYAKRSAWIWTEFEEQLDELRPLVFARLREGLGSGVSRAESVYGMSETCDWDALRAALAPSDASGGSVSEERVAELAPSDAWQPPASHLPDGSRDSAPSSHDTPP